MRWFAVGVGMMRWFARLFTLVRACWLAFRLTAARARVRRGRPLGTADHEGTAPTRAFRHAHWHPPPSGAAPPPPQELAPLFADGKRGAAWRAGSRRGSRRALRRAPCQAALSALQSGDGGMAAAGCRSLRRSCCRTARRSTCCTSATPPRCGYSRTARYPWVLTYGMVPLGSARSAHAPHGDAHSCTVRNQLLPCRLHVSALRCAASLAPLPPFVDARPGASPACGAQTPLFRVLQYSYSTPAQYRSTPAARRFRSFRRAWRCRCRGRPRCCSCRSSGTV
jgi:hypothetical protein